MTQVAGSRMSLRERKKAEQRDRIFRAARDLFIAQGYVATSMDEIARAADVSRATVFNYYSSKDAILAEFAAGVYDVFERLVEDVRAQPGSTVERIRNVFEISATRAVRTRAFTHEIFLEVASQTMVGVPDGDPVRRVYRAFERLVDDGRELGDVRVDLGAEFMAQIIGGIYFAQVVNWIHDPDYPLTRRMADAASFVVDAIEA